MDNHQYQMNSNVAYCTSSVTRNDGDHDLKNNLEDTAQKNGNEKRISENLAISIKISMIVIFLIVILVLTVATLAAIGLVRMEQKEQFQELIRSLDSVVQSCAS